MKLTLADLLPGTHYVVQVRVANANEQSAWSPAFDFFTDEDSVLPKTPTNVTWVVVGDSFYGEWDSVGEKVNNDYANITRYELELVGNSVTKIVSVPQITQSRNNYILSFEDNKSFFATPAPTVRMRIRSVDTNDLKSAWSTPITVTNPSPEPPTTLTATGSTGNIAVAWKASVSDDVVGYNVYVGTTAGFTPGPTNLMFSGSATSFIYNTASTSTQYFKVRAVDKFNQESIDATANAAASSPFVVDTTPPPVPTALAGTITNNADGLGARVALTWTMASPPSDLAGFYVRYRRVGDTNFSNAAFQKGDRAGIIELQKAYQNYEFQIKAYDWQNNESAWSSTVTVTSPANSAPANVSGLTGAAGRDSIVYKWNAVADLDIKKYEVTFSTSSTFASGNVTYLTGTSTTLTVSGLTPATTYYARVRAVDNSGLNSAAWSSTVNATTTAASTSDGVPPSSSPTPSASGGFGYIFASWTAVVNADPVTYEVHLSSTSGFTPNSGTKVSEISGTSTVIDRLPGGGNLVYGTQYYVKLIAKDVDGSAAAGAQSASATPLKSTINDIILSEGDITSRLGRNSITADKVFIGSLENFILDPSFQYPIEDSWSFPAGGSAPWSYFESSVLPGKTIKGDAGGVARRISSKNRVSVAPGSKVAVFGKYATGSTWAGTGPQIVIQSRDQSGGLVNSASRTLGATGDTWKDYAFIIDIPTTTTIRTIDFDFQISSGSTAGSVYFARPVWRMAAVGELLVDGAVTARTVAAGAIQAETLSVGARSDNLVVNGSFEDWDGELPNGWNTDASTDVYVGRTIEKSTGLTGSTAPVIGRGSGGQGRLYTLPSSRIACKPLDKFIARADYAFVTGTPTVQLSVYFYTANNTYISGGTPDVGGEITGSSITVLRTAPANAAWAGVGIAVTGGNSGDKIKFDNVELRSRIGGAHILDAAIGTAQIDNLAVTNAKILNLSGDKIDVKSLYTNRLVVGDYENYWPDRHFNDGSGSTYFYTTTNAVSFDTTTPPGGGNCIVLKKRDHMASQLMPLIPVKEGDEFYIEVTYKRIAGSASFGSSLMAALGENGQTLTNWWNMSQLVTETKDLGGGWFRRKVISYINRPDARKAALYLQIDQNSPYGTEFLISDIVIMRRNSGEMILDGTLKVNKLAAGTIGADVGITMAPGSSILLNGGHIRSNTYNGSYIVTGGTAPGTYYAQTPPANGTTQNGGTVSASTTPSAGFYIGNDGIMIAQGKIKANSLESDTLTSTTITLGSGGSIVGGSWTLNSSGLTIPDGVISASKLRLQTASNIAPFQFSSFPFPPTSYSFPAAGDSTTATVVGIDGSVIPYTGDQMLKISWGSLTAARIQHLLPTSTGAATADRSVDVRPNTTYIVSAWLYSPSACVDNELRLNFYGVNTTTNTINTGLYGVQGPLRKVDDGSTGLAAGTWTRMRATILTNASVTRVVISPTNYQTGTPKVIYYSGIQVEEKITTGTDVESLKPGPYMIPGLTAVDGGMIKTGSIQSTSTTASQTWNGTTNTWVSSSQPTWAINTNGNATFWHAQVRGDLVVGNSGDPLTSQAIVRSQNWSYTNDTTFTGWAIEGNGSAFFNNVTARGDIEATSINAVISPNSGGGIYARGEMGESVQLTGNGFNVFGAYEIPITHIQVTGGNTITVTTAGSHGFTTGNKVSLSGLSNANYNGTYGGSGIVSTPSATTFTVQKAGLTNAGNTAMSGVAKSSSNGSANSERALLVEFPTDGARPNIISGQLTTENLSVSGVSQFQGTMNLQNGVFFISKGISNPASAPTATATYSGITPQPRSWTELGNGLTKGSEGSWYALDRNTSTNAIQIIRISSGLGTKTVMASFSDADFVSYAGIVYSSANSRYYAGYVIEEPGQPKKLTLRTYNTSFTPQDTKIITLPGNAGAYGKWAALGWDYVGSRLILLTDDFGPNARRVDYIALSSGIPSASLTTGMSLTGYLTGAISANPTFVTRIDDSSFASGERIISSNRQRIEVDSAPIFEAYNSSGAKLVNESWASPGTYLFGVHFDSSKKIFSARAADSFAGTNEKIIDFENGNSWWTNNTSLYQIISAKYTYYKRIATKTATVTNRSASTTQITLTTSSSSFNASDNGKWVEVTGLGVRFNGVWKIVGNPTSTSIVLDSPGTTVTAAAASGQVALDVYETAASPETTAPAAKRAKVYVSVPSIPKTSAPESPDRARVYVYTTGGGSNPAMSLISHPGTAIVSTLGPSATNYIVTPPATNAFANINSPSFISNTDATSYWSGTGEALFTGVSVTGAVNAWAVNTTEDTGWNDITTFYNSWVNYDGRKAQYKRLGKQVWLRGVIKNGSLADALLIPTGFRPANTSDTGQRLWICASGGGIPALVTIMPSNGILSVQTGSNAWLSLDNITYLTN